MNHMDIGAAATLACVWEATAPKPGNVYPGAAFDDTTYADFVLSAVVVGPILQRTAEIGVGQAVLDAVRATRDAVGTNTNLGTLLLVAPLAAVPSGLPIAHGICDVLARLTVDDTRHVYEAIRLSGVSGLGRADVADVFDPTPPKLNLLDAMRLAADRDLVARQYAHNFADVFRIAAAIADATGSGLSLSASIVRAYLQQLAAEPDSLVARKCGATVAREVSQRAAAAVATGETVVLDAWLRADGHRRNPGTTADLIAAALFVLLCDGRLHWTKW